jgi:NAD(P)-dependent dehydrogenase (short-subunit alcohol dehydrogenase family)
MEKSILTCLGVDHHGRSEDHLGKIYLWENGVIHTIRPVAPGMKERGYSRIVNIASNAAIGAAPPGTTLYAATKAEVLILTRRLAMELGRRGDDNRTGC